MPPAVGETSDPGTVGSLPGSRRSEPFGVDALHPVGARAVPAADDVLAGDAIDREEVAVARRGRHQLALLPVDDAVDEDRRLRRIPVVHVVRRGLEVPGHLAGVDVDGDQRAGEEIVPFAAPDRVGGNRVAGAEDVELGLGIVDAGQPRHAAAVARRVEAGPRVEPRVAGVHRHGVELPLQLAGLGIERLQEPGRVEIVAGADDHVVADDERRRGREVLLVEVGDGLVPALVAGLRVERHQVVVGRRHVEIAVPHAEAAIGDVRAAAGLPEVVPQLAAVARVDRPGVVGRRDVERAVHHQRRALDGDAAARRQSPVPSPPTIRPAPPPPPPRPRPPPLALPAVRLMVHASVRFLTVRRLTCVSAL